MHIKGVARDARNGCPRARSVLRAMGGITIAGSLVGTSVCPVSIAEAAVVRDLHGATTGMCLALVWNAAIDPFCTNDPTNSVGAHHWNIGSRGSCGSHNKW